MAEKKFIGGASAIKQKSTWDTIARGTNIAATWIITATGEDGSTHAISVSQTGNTAPATSILLSNFTSNWNNDGSKVVQRVTASNTSSVLTLTAKTAGQPFRVVSTVSGTGSPTWGTSTDPLTSNSGPNVWHQTDNWEGEAIPVDDDGLTIGAGASDILWGLTSDGTGANLTSSHTQFIVEEGYTGQIGGTDDAYFEVHLVAGKPFRFSGTGQSWIDIKASNVDPEIYNSYSPADGQYGLSLKGTSISDIYINKGNVGLGVEPGNDVQIENININYIDNPATDAKVTIGADVTHTTSAQGPVVIQTAGVCEAYGDVNKITVDGGVYTQKSGAITSTILLRGTGQLNTDSVTSYTQTSGGNTFTMTGESVLDNSRTMGTKVIGKTITVKGSVTINDPNAQFNYAAAPDIDLDQINMTDVTLNLGRNRTLVIGAS